MKPIIRFGVICALCAHSAFSFALTIDMATQNKLGIQSQTPLPLPAVAQYYPAQVFVPQQNQQHVSLSHTVTLLNWLVEPYQTIQTGQPLARLFSNTLLEASHAWLIARNKEQLIGQQLKREKALFEQGLTPKKRLDIAQSEYEQSQFTTRMAAQQCLHLGLGEKALLDMVKQGAATGELTLVAKDAGRIVKLEATQGRSLSSGETLLSYQNGDARWLEFSLSATDALTLSAGNTFNIKDTAYTAILIGQQPERNTSQKVMFLAKIDQAPDIMPGQWVSLQLNRISSKTFEVPRQAITYLDSKPYLFLLKENEIDKMAVELLGSTRSGWQVRAEKLSDSDKIIVQGGASVKALLDGSSHE